MSIAFTKYVNITSGVIGSGAVRARELILRVFSTNPLIPSNSLAEFTSAADVSTFFGSTSTEYAIAAFYFGFLSKTIVAPSKICFASWVQTAIAPTIFGSTAATATLTALQAIAAGRLNLTLGATTRELTGLNFSAAGSLAAVATSLQTAINAVTTDPQWLTAAVTFDATRGAFKLVGGAVGVAPVKVNPASTGVDAGVAIGWEDINTLFSAGSAAMSLTQTLIASSAASSNFGSFSFVPTLNQAQHVEIATWLATVNVTYMYLARTSAANATAFSGALVGFAGVSLTADGTATGQFPSLLPGAILAATDYTKRNASQNYMYQQYSAIAANVTDDTTSAAYDNLRINYYGQTQTAGQLISFYQRGVLMGGANAPTDMNIYANEMWFKSEAGDAFMSLMLALNQVSTNAGGRAQLISTLQSVITKALFNGVISVANAPFTNTQILTITQISGSAKAWYQVQNSGYWFDVSFSSTVTQDGRTEYQGNYTLIYTKNNAIRSVQGTHDLV